MQSSWARTPMKWCAASKRRSSMARNRSSSRAAHLLFVTILSLLSMTPRASAAFGDITLVGHLTLPGAPRVTNVWGYYDYKTHKEYALVGDDKGGFFIAVSYTHLRAHETPEHL